MGDTFPNCVNTKKDGIEHKVVVQVCFGIQMSGDDYLVSVTP